MNIDFGALRDKASAMLDGTPEAPVAPGQGAAPVVETPKVETPAKETPKVEETPAAVVETPAPVKAQLTDDTLVEVIVDGETVTMPWKEAKAGISRTSKFTKSMQQLAKDRSAIEQERGSLDSLRQERDAMRTLLSHPQALAQFMVQQNPGLLQQPQQSEATYDPNEIATVGQARQIAAQQAQTFEAQLSATQQSLTAQMQQALQAKTVEIEERQQTAKHAVVINTTLADIFTQNPVLKAIPDAEDVLRYNVAKMNPQTESEALDAFRTVAKGMVEDIGKHFTANQKVQAVQAAKAKLVSKTVEPAGGGSGPQLAPTSFKDTTGAVDWKKVFQMAKDYNG